MGRLLNRLLIRIFNTLKILNQVRKFFCHVLKIGLDGAHRRRICENRLSTRDNLVRWSKFNHIIRSPGMNTLKREPMFVFNKLKKMTHTMQRITV